MNVLGISYSLGPNPAASLLMDGKLVAMAEEERFIRIKTAASHFPARSVDFCLSHAGLELTDIDSVACAWDANKYTSVMPAFYNQLAVQYGGKGRMTEYGERALLNFFQPEYMTLRIAAGLTHGRGRTQVPDIRFLSHHLCHAASTFCCSGFDESAVLTIDGSGEEQCTVLWKADRSGLTQIESINLPHSLGWLYAGMTEYLGFRPYSDEGSVMGLSCYGHEEDEIEQAFDRLITLTPSGYEIDPRFIHFGGHRYGSKFTDRLVELLGPPRVHGQPLTPRHQNIAWTLQHRLEQATLHVLKRLVALTGSRRLCLAGGVAMNCKMNQQLRESGLIDEIFIQPASTDAGTALGAAMVVSREAGHDPSFKMTHAYWGPEVSHEAMRRVLTNHQIRFKTHADIASEVAARLSRGEIVGWFQGRSEIGARALGSRSILASPLTVSMKDRVNDAVKYREPWRPFAPSMVEEHMRDYVVNACPHPFMILTFTAVEERANQIPAVVHVDRTLRPQTVREEDNPLYYRLLKEFHRLTGVPMILNTSFNVKGEPIVNSVDDAIRSFYGSGLNALAIGDFLLEK